MRTFHARLLAVLLALVCALFATLAPVSAFVQPDPKANQQSAAVVEQQLERWFKSLHNDKAEAVCDHVLSLIELFSTGRSWDAHSASVLADVVGTIFAEPRFVISPAWPCAEKLIKASPSLMALFTVATQTAAVVFPRDAARNARAVYDALPLDAQASPVVRDAFRRLRPAAVRMRADMTLNLPLRSSELACDAVVALADAAVRPWRMRFKQRLQRAVDAGAPSLEPDSATSPRDLAVVHSSMVKVMILAHPQGRSSVVGFTEEELSNELPLLYNYWYAALAISAKTNLASERGLAVLEGHSLAFPKYHIFNEFLSSVNFAVSYINVATDVHLKSHINSVLQSFLVNPNAEFSSARFLASPHMLPAPHSLGRAPPARVLSGRGVKIAVITQFWLRFHSIYRTFVRFARALARSGFALHLVMLGAAEDEVGLEPGLFANVNYYPEQNDIDRARLIEKLCLTEKFDAIYYPDVGMSFASILLSNMRLAPVQFTTQGHSVSTFGSQIDYYLSGDETERADLELVAGDFSERVVLVPGLSVVSEIPLALGTPYWRLYHNLPKETTKSDNQSNGGSDNSAQQQPQQPEQHAPSTEDKVVPTTDSNGDSKDRAGASASASAQSVLGLSRGGQYVVGDETTESFVACAEWAWDVEGLFNHKHLIIALNHAPFKVNAPYLTALARGLVQVQGRGFELRMFPHLNALLEKGAFELNVYHTLRDAYVTAGVATGRAPPLPEGPLSDRYLEHYSAEERAQAAASVVARLTEVYKRERSLDKASNVDPYHWLRTDVSFTGGAPVADAAKMTIDLSTLEGLWALRFALHVHVVVYNGLKYAQYITTLASNVYSAQERNGCTGTFAVEAFPFGGCNTVNDALWAGVPVITHRGTRFNARVGSATLARVSPALGRLLLTTTAPELSRAVAAMAGDDEFRARVAVMMRAASLAPVFGEDVSPLMQRWAAGLSSMSMFRSGVAANKLATAKPEHSRMWDELYDHDGGSNDSYDGDSDSDDDRRSQRSGGRHGAAAVQYWRRAPEDVRRCSAADAEVMKALGPTGRPYTPTRPGDDYTGADADADADPDCGSDSETEYDDARAEFDEIEDQITEEVEVDEPVVDSAATAKAAATEATKAKAKAKSAAAKKQCKATKAASVAAAKAKVEAAKARASASKAKQDDGRGAVNAAFSFDIDGDDADDDGSNDTADANAEVAAAESDLANAVSVNCDSSNGADTVTGEDESAQESREELDSNRKFAAIDLDGDVDDALAPEIKPPASATFRRVKRTVTRTVTRRVPKQRSKVSSKLCRRTASRSAPVAPLGLQPVAWRWTPAQTAAALSAWDCARPLLTATDLARDREAAAAGASGAAARRAAALVSEPLLSEESYMARAVDLLLRNHALLTAERDESVRTRRALPPAVDLAELLLGRSAASQAAQFARDNGSQDRGPLDQLELGYDSDVDDYGESQQWGEMMLRETRALYKKTVGQATVGAAIANAAAPAAGAGSSAGSTSHSRRSGSSNGDTKTHSDGDDDGDFFDTTATVTVGATRTRGADSDKMRDEL